jgi:hypothetical protein
MPRATETSTGDRQKGVFCLEGEWTGSLENHSSLEPMLEIIRNQQRNFSYIHRPVLNKVQFRSYLSQWVRCYRQKYPILYLACHGEPGTLFLRSSMRRPGIPLDFVEQLLADKCKGCVIYFGACSAFDLEGQRIARFRRNTKALAVCGYRNDAEWTVATAFELMFLTAMQANPMTIAGMRAVQKTVRTSASCLVENLGFDMLIRKKQRPVPRR